MQDSVTLLGVRGSVPVSGPEYRKYGGATSCVLVTLDGRHIILDAGSGLMNIPGRVMAEPSLSLLLTHPHADHLIGLPLFPYALRPGKELCVYAVTRNGLGPREQAESLMRPPLWPVTPDGLPAELAFRELRDGLCLDGVTVGITEGVHPGGVTIIRLSANGKTVVYATDCTLTPELTGNLADFARGCDLLLIDGQYSDDEWPARKDFGHSAWAAAAGLGKLAGAKRTVIIHHDPCHTDAMLDAAAASLSGLYPGCAFGREGEEISL